LIPDGITRVARVAARLAPHRWDWAEAQSEAIAAHWARRKAAKPAIFNGRVLMIAESRHQGDTLHARFFATDYANLLAWLDWDAPDRSVENGFAMGAMTASDGAFLLGIMGQHTSQAGRIYFPAGTPDLSDVGVDGTVDLATSITREIEEETGLVPADYDVAPDWIVTRIRGYTALMREVRLREPAEAARHRILGHLGREAEPELADIRIARGPADIDERAMPDYLKAFLRWRFAEPA
jgi:8-oxo-dGTP pyrophosphatase MutT (NUDIX family)